MRPSFFAWVMVLLPVCGLVAGGATVRGALDTVRMIDGKA